MSFPILLGLGNPLLDISAEVNDAFLDKYKLKANDAILANESHAALYKDLISEFKVTYVAGGATQNTIRGAQWLMPAGTTAYIGCVGEDEYATQLTKAAEQDGVRVHYMKSKDVPTGTCAVMITNKGAYRSLVANLSAAEKYKVDHLHQVWDSVVKGAQIYYISGFFLTVSPETILMVAKHVHTANHTQAEKKKLMCMNLSAPFISQFFSKPLLEALPYVDYLFGNETEAVSFAEMNQWEERDVLQIAKKILATYPKLDQGQRTIIFTQGSDDVITATMDYKSKVVTALHHPIIPIPAEKIVDTNGAGDAFVGGFLAQLALQKDLDTCIKAGVWTAHIVIQQNGPVYPKSVQVPKDFSTLTFTQV